MLKEVRRSDGRVLRFTVWFFHDGRIWRKERRLTLPEYLLILAERQATFEMLALIGSTKLPFFERVVMRREWVVESEAVRPVRGKDDRVRVKEVLV